MSRPPSELMKILFLTIITGIGATAMGFCSVCVLGGWWGETGLNFECNDEKWEQCWGLLRGSIKDKGGFR